MSQSSQKLSDLLASIESIDHTTFPDENERFKAIYAARQLCNRIERPWDRLLDLSLTAPANFAALKIGVASNLFNALQGSGGQALTVHQIATKINAEPDFIGRLLRQLAANGFVADKGDDTYAANDFTTEMTKPEGGPAVISFLYDLWLPSVMAAPQYVAERQYQSPSDAENTAMIQGLNEPPANFFQFLGANPTKARDFSLVMKGYNSSKQSWTDFYPIDDITKDAPPDGVLIVDIGGNVGVDIDRFLKERPQTRGMHVLQDLPNVVESVPQTDRFKVQAHDFFIPQPVQGARAYYMHAVLHDWPDDVSRKILENLKPAFKKGYSKLLIQEIVIPTEGANSYQTRMDWVMMLLLANHERTEANWRALVESAGFKVTRIVPGRLESIIEAELE